MANFIQVFFEKYGQDFTFLSYQDVLSDFWDHRLTTILANCLAAMAVKCVLLSVRGVHASDLDLGTLLCLN